MSHLARAGRSFRFAWQIQRFEYLAVLIVSVPLLLLCFWDATRLSSVTPPAECFRTWFATATAGPACGSIYEFFDRLNDEGSQLVGLLTIFPAFLGLVLGTTVVSAEIEHKTAELAWALSPSRRRWLLDRVWPALLIAAIVSAVAAVAGETLQGAAAPWLDARASFADYGGRGLPLVARSLTLTALGVLVGAAVGRQLPAFLIGIAAAVVVLVVLQKATPFGLPLVPVEVTDPFTRPLALVEAYEAPDGSLLTRDQARAEAPADLPRSELDEWVFSNFPIVRLGIPGSQLPDVELRESLLLAVVGTTFLALAMLAVERRRPY